MLTKWLLLVIAVLMHVTTFTADSVPSECRDS